MVRTYKKSRGWPIGWILLPAILALAVIILFGLRYLGSEQPQKIVELRVTPPVEPVKVTQTTTPAENAKAR
jgi:quinol-cytochrome oxidoreductase complex cytochrome b subunit